MAMSALQPANNHKSAVITGASTGIGYACAAALLEHDYRVFGSVRRAEDGERLRHEFGPGFTPLIFDVTDATAVQQAAETVEVLLAGRGLSALINNAGIAEAGPLQYLPMAQLRSVFETNVFGVIQVTQAFLPLLGAGPAPFGRHPAEETPKPGRIINISSVSGRIAFPFLGPYAASKHALEALSDALRRELLVYGIDVIVIEPGSVRTPIWDKAARIDTSLYAETIYAGAIEKMLRSALHQGKEQGMPVERVAETVVRALEVGRPRARYALPNTWLAGWILPRILPDRLLDGIVKRQMSR